MKIRTLLLALFLQCFLATLNASAAAYTITDLGPLHPLSVNDSGQAAGCVIQQYNSSNYRHVPAAWLNGSLLALQPAATEGMAYALNNNGVIVGWVGSSEAATWNFAGQVTLLSAGPGAYAPYARALNNQGLIVGAAAQGSPSGLLHACCWNNGLYTDLGVPSGQQQSAAEAVNSSGAIVVNSWGQSGSLSARAYLYRNGSFTPLLADVPALSLSSSSTSDINDAGMVIGSAQFSNHSGSGYLWQDGVTTWLPAVPGKAIASPMALNNSGVVVGYGFDADGYSPLQFRACVWDQGQVTFLDDLAGVTNGWRFSYAYDINDAGQIVGEGTLNGAYHGFLLTPVPEPSTLALLGVGALCSWQLTRRQRRGR